MIENVEALIRDYLPNIIHVSLASSRGDQPWVCEVHYAYDDDLNLYFRSRTNTRHAGEIRDNPKVAGSIVIQHGPTDKPRGVYFQGTCELLEDVTNSDPAYLAYSQRFELGEEIIDEARTADGHQFYKITPSSFFVFDSRESRPSTKYELPWQ